MNKHANSIDEWPQLASYSQGERQAFAEGRRDYSNGKPASQNPYPIYSMKFMAYEEGRTEQWLYDLRNMEEQISKGVGDV
jgi:hypothetical protein